MRAAIRAVRRRTSSAPEYALEEIEDGLVPDPSIRAGERIEVSRAKTNDRHRFDQDKSLAALAPTLYYPLRQV